MIDKKVFYVLLFVLLSGVKETTAACNNMGVFTDCFSNFSQALGTSLSNPFTYISQISNYLNNDVEFLCRAQANLSQCITSTNMAVNYVNVRCIFDADNSTIATIVARFNQLNEACGSLKYQLRNSYNCMNNLYYPYDCKNSKESDENQQKDTCPSSNDIQCALKNMASSCGSVNTYVGCRWMTVEYSYTTTCTKFPDCSSYTDLLNETYCFYDYFKAWEVVAGRQFPTSDTFIEYFYTYLIAEDGNFDTACQRYRDFYKCIGDTDDAFDAFIFSQILTEYKSNTTANKWIAAFQKQKFICDNGADGVRELAECDASTAACITLQDSCNEQINQIECANRIVSDKCGKRAAYFQCTNGNIDLQYTGTCGNRTLDCSQYNSGSIVGIGMTLIFSLLFLLN